MDDTLPTDVDKKLLSAVKDSVVQVRLLCHHQCCPCLLICPVRCQVVILGVNGHTSHEDTCNLADSQLPDAS